MELGEFSLKMTFTYFCSVLENLKENYSPKVVCWKDCTFHLNLHFLSNDKIVSAFKVMGHKIQA